MSKNKINIKSDAASMGIRVGVVAGFRLHSGRCPAGVVTAMERDHFTMRFLDIGNEFRGGALLDIGYAEVHSVRIPTYTLLNDGTKVYDDLTDTALDWHRQATKA